MNRIKSRLHIGRSLEWDRAWGEGFAIGLVVGLILFPLVVSFLR
jgi:hypothetical protein